MALFELMKRSEEIKFAANQGDTQAQYDLGCMYEEGRGVKQDSAKAMQCYLKAAERGHAKAQYDLGLMYSRLPPNKKNEEEAIKWIQLAMEGFHLAAENGDAEAQCRLGEIYDMVKSESQNKRIKTVSAAVALVCGEKDTKWYEEESAKWFQMATEVFRQAAEQGDMKAQFELGGIYCWFMGGRENEEKGLQWFQKAAEQGLVDAQHELGYMYSTGWCVADQDIIEALKWYTRAAEQGHLLAQTFLAKTYAGCDRLIEPPHYAEALKWYLKIAELGDTSAQHNIGVIHAKGQGVAQNLTEAQKWLRKAVEQGNENAKKSLQLLGAFLNQQDEKALEQLELIF
ncbi:MAG: sel1 repeat family protein [Betaproteobacteria bacterium]|nr:sel1 repeat family protein [Betaproteobacteria bacterium]